MLRVVLFSWNYPRLIEPPGHAHQWLYRLLEKQYIRYSHFAQQGIFTQRTTMRSSSNKIGFFWVPPTLQMHPCIAAQHDFVSQLATQATGSVDCRQAGKRCGLFPALRKAVQHRPDAFVSGTFRAPGKITSYRRSVTHQRLQETWTPWR